MSATSTHSHPRACLPTGLLLCLQDVLPLPEFLGPYVPPQNLTLNSLRSVADKKHGDFAAVIAAGTIRLKAAVGTGGGGGRGSVHICVGNFKFQLMYFCTLYRNGIRPGFPRMQQ